MTRLIALYLCFSWMLLAAPAAFAQPDYELPGYVFTNLKKALASPDSVVRLKLRRKGFKEIPPEVFQFPNLQELDLGSNKITQLPTNIAQLKNLKILRLNRNKIQVVGKELGELTDLIYLDLGRNQIQALPFEIGKLKKLEFLQIWGNEITMLPESINDLSALKWLDMRAILLTDSEREELLEQLPQTEVLISPGCNCGK
jgi:Leucine-rich repeat (LRR) protein